jgi:PhnB protein
MAPMAMGRFWRFAFRQWYTAPRIVGGTEGLRRNGRTMRSTDHRTVISLMLAVPDTPAAVEWYKEALGAELLWSLGSVAGLQVDGAPFFLHEPVKSGFESPQAIRATTVRVEVFVDDPDKVIARAIEAGATGGDIRDHEVSWGKHRQGGFTDPFGHIWLVGDKTPLSQHGGE